MDHGITNLTEEHQYWDFHLQNQVASSRKISVVVQFGCWTEEGALQIAWDKKRPWLWTLRTARGLQTPSAKGKFSQCSEAVQAHAARALWPGEGLARMLQAAWTLQ